MSRQATYAAVRRLRAALPSGSHLPEQLFQRWDRLIRGVLWAHVPVLAVLALLGPADSLHSGLEVGAVIVLAIAAQIVRHRAWRACVTSAGLITCSAVLVHVTGGLAEAHFHFFIMIPLIALYHDWRPYLVAAGYVVVHHGVVGLLVPSAVYEDPAAVAHPVAWALLHGAAIAAASAVQLVFWRGNEQARLEIAAHSEQARSLALRAAAAEREAALLQLAAALSEALTPAEVAAVIVEAGGATVGASGGALSMLDERGKSLRILHMRGYDEGFRRRWNEMPLTYPAPLTAAVNRGSALYLSTIAELEDAYPELAAQMGPEGRGARAALPLKTRGRVIGGWVLTWDHDRPSLAEADHVRLSTIATLGAQALERARLYEHERDTAQLLQRGLLPTALPELQDVAVHARYSPGADGARVGGDWYDVLALPTGRIGIAVGDVTGHDLEAAAAMGHLRTTLRAYAAEGHSPAAVMERLNRLLTDTADADADASGRLATCVYLELDPVAATVTVTSAGHPPPLLLPPHGSPHLLDLDPDLPLGIDRDAGYSERTLKFPAGSTVVLYTDGLVEHRYLPLQAGLDRLLAATGSADARSPEALLDSLVSAMAPVTQQLDRADDMTALAMRFQPGADGAPQSAAEAGSVCTLRAQPSSAGTAREFVREALESAGCTHLTDTATLLVSELATNAVVHTGSVEFVLGVRPSAGKVRIDVRDSSAMEPAPQAPSEDRTSGRGLAILEALACDWGVEHDAHGKTVWFELAR